MRSGIPKAEKRILKRENKSNDVLSYDEDNVYPQRIKDILNASGTAKRSTEVYAKFIIGGGFKDKLFYKSVVNEKGLTADKLLRFAANDFSEMGGCAYHINYNGLLQKTDISNIPFEYCRIGCSSKAGMIAVYDDWDCTKKNRIDLNEIKWYHRYINDKTIILSQIASVGGILNYNGQIKYPANYPLAPVDPVIEDVLSDKNIKTFTEKELKNGFNPSMIGRYSKSHEDDEWEGVMDSYREFQGPENTGKIFLIDGIEKDAFELMRLESSGADKMYDLTEKRVKNSIIQRFGQPPSIVGRRDQNVTFSSQNIEDDTKFYNSVTNSERLLFEEDMKELFNGFHLKVNETNDWSILELQFNAISTEKPSKISTLGIGGAQAAQALIIDQTVDPTQKINVLQYLYGFTIEEAQACVLPIPKVND